MRTRTIFAALLLAGAALQLSCDSPNGAPGGDAFLPWFCWTVSRPASYTVVEQRFCFCLRGDTAALVTVRNGAITEVANSATQAPLPREQWAAYKTIDELFAMISRYRSDEEARVEARYDDVYGYPRWLSVDPIRNAVDDEFIYVCEDLRRLPGSDGSAP